MAQPNVTKGGYVSDKIKVTVEQRSPPNLRKLARALIALATRKDAEGSGLAQDKAGELISPHQPEAA
jgi:hypothetical protein